MLRRVLPPLAVVCAVGSGSVAACSGAEQTQTPTGSVSAPARAGSPPIPKCLRIDAEPVADKPHTMLLQTIVEGIEPGGDVGIKDIDYEFGDGTPDATNAPASPIEHAYPGPGTYTAGASVEIETPTGQGSPVKGNLVTCFSPVVVP